MSADDPNLPEPISSMDTAALHLRRTMLNMNAAEMSLVYSDRKGTPVFSITCKLTLADESAIVNATPKPKEQHASNPRKRNLP